MPALEEVVAARGEGVDKMPGFQSLAGVDRIGRHNQRVPLLEDVRFSIHREREATGADKGGLDVRMAVRCADPAFAKPEFDRHQIRIVGQDPAFHALARRGPPGFP